MTKVERGGLKRISLALVLTLACPEFAQAQVGPPVSKQSVPSVPPSVRAAIRDQQDELLIRRLVTQSLVALNQANETGNYTVFHALASPEFQVKNPIPRLSETFRPVREARLDLGAIINGPTQLLPAPYIDSQNRMFVQGALSSGPDTVGFALQFVAVNNVWRLQEVALSNGSPSTR